MIVTSLNQEATPGASFSVGFYFYVNQAKSNRKFLKLSLWPYAEGPSDMSEVISEKNYNTSQSANRKNIAKCMT